MLFEKDGKTMEVSGDVQIAAFKRSGWREMTKKARKSGVESEADGNERYSDNSDGNTGEKTPAARRGGV